MNKAQYQIIVLLKFKLSQHLNMSKTQLMEFILKIEEIGRRYFNKTD
jgi:hypothetical protein